MNKTEIIEAVENLLFEIGVWGNAYFDDDKLAIEIENGDWKHDHILVDTIIKENFNVVYNTQVTTEEDGSDCYSAIHYYVLG